MQLPTKVAIFYQADKQKFSLMLEDIYVDIMVGPEAELTFNNVCEQLENKGYLGKQLTLLADDKGYIIEVNH